MKQQTKLTIIIFESNIGPIMLRNMLGQAFDSTLDRFLTQNFHMFGTFPFFKICRNLYFYTVSGKKCDFIARPQKLGTLFVNTTAQTDFCRFFNIFVFWGFCCVRFWGLFFERNEKHKLITKQQKQNKTTRYKPENHIVLLQESKQTTQTQNNATSLKILQTNNTRNKNQNKNINYKKTTF